MIADTYYPGWHAVVDGKSASVVPVNGAMRGIYVTNGKHHVEMRYECVPFRIGAIVSAITLVAALALLCGLSAMRSKTQRPEEKAD